MSTTCKDCGKQFENAHVCSVLPDSLVTVVRLDGSTLPYNEIDVARYNESIFEPKEPTGKQCEQQERFEQGQHKGFYTWYPQMGGYSGKAAIVIVHKRDESTCFDAYIWHDGEFPFSDKPPILLHHCRAEQFITLGEEVLAVHKAIREEGMDLSIRRETLKVADFEGAKEWDNASDLDVQARQEVAKRISKGIQALLDSLASPRRIER